MARTVVITGGARGLGAAITRTFYKEGDHIAILSRNDSGLAAELGERAKFIRTDLSDVSQIKEAFAKVAQWTGRVDILINNAGFSAWQPLQDIDEDFWDSMISVNLKGLMFASQAAEKQMQNGAVIINISSLAGKRGSANNAVYCASKFGVNGITQALAKELGPKGVRVNAVCPVYIRTEGLENALSEVNSPLKGGELDEFLADFARTQTALGVLPTDQQVADTCLYLASSHAAAITGQCLNVDCGVMPQ